MLMRSNAFQSLQHFVSFQGDAAVRCVRPGKHGAPDRVCVQNRAGIPATNNRKMQQGFSRRAAAASNDVRPIVNL